ncbi:MAG: hypothetical protein M1358_16100, partial [Chloroflexi bacterium]|nr:hypothetical protein [Chloroflexota bacterium]
PPVFAPAAEEPEAEHQPEGEAQAQSVAAEQLVLDEPEPEEAPSEVVEAQPEVPIAVAESPAEPEGIEEIASEPEELSEEMEYAVSAEEVQEAAADTADLAVRLRDALGEAVGRTGQLTELAEAISQSVTAEWQKATSLLEQLEETRSRMDDRERSLTESLEIKEQQETELASLRKELSEAETERELIDRDLAGVTDLLKRLTGRVSIYAQQTNLSELASLVDDVVSNPRDIDYASALTRRASSLAELLKVWEEIMAGLDEVSSAVGRLKVG